MGSSLGLAFSYYDGFSQATILKKKEVPEIRNIWAGRRGFGVEPNVAAAFELGTKLGVDAAIMYAMNPGIGPDYLIVYLIDILHKRKYILEGEVYYYENDGITELARMAERVFDDFMQYRHSR